mgnify:CR=1 FL=1
MTDLFGGSLHLAPAAAAILGLMVGALLGLAHFGSLWWNVRLYTGGSAGRALAVQLLRLAILVAVFVGLAKLGAAALLAGALGLLVTRHLVMRRLGLRRTETTS